MSTKVLIDESYRDLDQVCRRYIVGHVIISDEAIKEFEDWFNKNVVGDSVRFQLETKFHFTSLSTAQRDTVVEHICKLPITFKVYTSYTLKSSSSSTLKAELLKESIEHHEMNSPKSSYVVEHASEYDGIEKQLPQVEIVLRTPRQRPALLIPDILLGVFGGFLDTSDRTRSTDILKWHKLVYNQIRLEVFDFRPSEKQFLSRENKLT